MLLNKLMLLILIIATGVYTSYYGGKISYAIFYMTILMPVLSFIYIIYVFANLKLDQSLSKKSIVKGDKVSYQLTISNEQIIGFRKIRVYFNPVERTKEKNEGSIECALLPNTKEKFEKRLYFRYRGEYLVGVKSIEVTDFLSIFSFRTKAFGKLKLLVLPRLIHLNNLNIFMAEDEKKYAQMKQYDENVILDVDVRKYIAGDNIKSIHWKNSAKRQELQTRNYHFYPKMGVNLMIDLNPIKKELYDSIEIEDQVIETSLAIANYCYRNRLKTSVSYFDNQVNNFEIKNEIDFEIFYKICARINFVAENSTNETMNEMILNFGENNINILVLHDITKEMLQKIILHTINDHKISIIYIYKEMKKDKQEIIIELSNYGIQVISVRTNENIQEVLG